MVSSLHLAQKNIEEYEITAKFHHIHFSTKYGINYTVIKIQSFCKIFKHSVNSNLYKKICKHFSHFTIKKYVTYKKDIKPQ